MTTVWLSEMTRVQISARSPLGEPREGPRWFCQDIGGCLLATLDEVFDGVGNREGLEITAWKCVRCGGRSTTDSAFEDDDPPDFQDGVWWWVIPLRRRPIRQPQPPTAPAASE